MNLASQISCMSGFAAASNMAAFNAAWSAVSANVLAPMGLAAEQLGAPLSPPDNFAMAVDMRNSLIDGVRPALDRQLARFVDTHQPLTSEAFESEGFEGPVGAILLADRVYDHGVVSFDPAKMFIASALMLVERSPVAISHVPLKYGSSGLEGYRYTYHPMEEMRIQAEIDRLRVDEAPLGLTKIPHISRSARIRIIEQFAKAHGLPHPRLLGPKMFRDKLPGWKTQGQGIYRFYYEIVSERSDSGRIVQLMLDRLGIERWDDIPFADQARALRSRYERINWDLVSPQLKRYLLFRLADEAGIVHPRFLTSEHFKKFKIEELGSDLMGLYSNYRARFKEPGRAVNAILDEAGVTSFENLPWDVQLTGFKQRDKVQWDKVPASTQLKLLEMAMDSMPVKNGLKCPHLRVLNSVVLREFVFREIDVSLAGLHDYYRRRMPEDYNGTILDFMLDQLGVERFEELPYELQCLCLRYDDKRSLGSVPASLILRFMERLRDIHDLPHMRFILQGHMERTIIPEIGQSLAGVYTHFCLKRRSDDRRVVVDLILDHLGVPKFEDMPFALQLHWTQQPTGKIASWRRVPDRVIRHYLFETMREAGVSRPDDLRWRHFEARLRDNGMALQGLYNYLRHSQPASGDHIRTIDWAFARYGIDLQFSIWAKRNAGGGKMLDQSEKMFLLEMAKMGDRTAMDHLIFFYRPLIGWAVHRALAIWPRSRLTNDELVQLGRIEFSRIVESYDPAIASFETYVKKSLPWRLSNAIKRADGSIHLPAHYLEFMQRVRKVHGQLWRVLGREPSDEGLAGALGVTVETLEERRSLFTTEVSLFDPLGDDEDGSTYENIIEDVNAARPDNEHLDTDLRELFERAINGSGLVEKEKFVMRQRGLEDHTFGEIGQMLDLSRERVRQLAESAMRKIAEGPYAAVLKELLE